MCLSVCRGSPRVQTTCNTRVKQLSRNNKTRGFRKRLPWNDLRDVEWKIWLECQLNPKRTLFPVLFQKKDNNTGRTCVTMVVYIWNGVLSALPMGHVGGNFLRPDESSPGLPNVPYPNYMIGSNDEAPNRHFLHLGFKYSRRHRLFECLPPQLTARNQVSHSYKTADKITDSFILIVTLLG